MANLLANFNSNRLSSGDTFSHEGFGESTNAMGSEASSPVNFEEQMNQYASFLAIGSMMLFLLYTMFVSEGALGRQ